MFTDFVPVPDWAAAMGIDGGIAIGDLDGDGVPELIVFTIDAREGPNAGRYRVGRHLDATGAVTGWGPWHDVPDWPFWENAGGGVALADLSGSGTLDLVVFVVDAPVGPNVGYVRVGRTLDADRGVTGGWGPWQLVPDWPFWVNAGADCAVADLDGDGRPELVLLLVDAPIGTTVGYYRSARLAPDGTAGHWEPWTAVPGWHSVVTAGAGIAVADLDADGVAELLVLAVDDVVGRNVARYTVGWHLDGRGRPVHGWGPWQEVPGWRFHENQGAAAALHDLDGDGLPELALLAVDDPEGACAGLYRFLPVVTDLAAAATEGLWRLLEVESGVLAVHAALLPTGSVLFLAGGGAGTRVWHHPGRALSAPPTPVELRCCGHASLPDGRLLAAGGAERGSAFRGLAHAVVFDPHAGDPDPAAPSGRAGAWLPAPDMAAGRWYPTLVTQPGGDVLAVSGLGRDGHLTVVPERFDGVGWHAMPPSPPWPLYAHLFALDDGRMFYSGGQHGTNNGQRPSIWDPHTGAVVEVAGLPEPGLRHQSASVLLPPAQDQRVMIVGGGGWDPHIRGPVTATSAIVDLTAPVPAYIAGPALHRGRMHPCAVLLPDRTVLLTGGTDLVDDAALPAEIYDPAVNAWRAAAGSRVPRRYHSVALLMPDGTVVTAGSQPERGSEERRIEVFHPPYLFAGPRPSVAPDRVEVGYGETLGAQVGDADDIASAALMRPGGTTHSWDAEQRLVEVAFTVSAPDGLDLVLPTSPGIAPPGWYLLVVGSAAGVPSPGVWVHLQ